MRRIVSVALLCLVVIVSACKAPSGGSGGTADVSPADQVFELLEQGKIDAASDVVAAHESFFAGAYGDPEVKASLDRLTGALEYKYSPVAMEILDAVNTVEWPVPQSRWSCTKKKLDDVRAQMDALKKVGAFRYPRYRPASYSQAVAALRDKEAVIRSDAAKYFASFPLSNGTDFFAVYPVSLDAPSFLDGNSQVWKAAMSSFSAKQTETFLSTYGVSLPASAKKEMTALYFKSLCPKGRKASLKNILAAYEKCRAAGMPLDSIPGIKIAFLQVTSPDLIKDKAIDFPINVKVDVPFEATKASMRQAFSHKAVKDADILILMNVAVSKAKRVVDENQKIESMYVASYVKEENPEYEIVKAELEAATEQYHAAKSKTTTSWAEDLIIHWVEESQKEDAIADTDKRLKELKEKMRKTPKYLSVANYQPYPVSKAHMDIYKFATVNYYVIDKRNRTFFRDTFDVKHKAFFTVCYDLQKSDPNRDKFLQTSVLEEDVVRYEMEPVVVNLSDLLDQYSNRPAARKKFVSMAALHRAVVKDRSVAQAKHKAEDFGYDKYYDKRFDNVVVVRNLGSGLGSGFYVTDDMVLTNYHVVEENDYVQLKLFDDRETMGRVIARDARLDLALIQADIKQKPVQFYSQRTIPLGVTLEIIGHPDGLEYTITRGALSSIREMKPINYIGSNTKVRYIQTDTATNGGNSGGPVFYRNKVIGVLDWGYNKISDGRNAQGLNFAIHYSEVFKFLEHNGIRYYKGS